MTIQKPFFVTANNQLQLVALLMKGNQGLAAYFPTPIYTSSEKWQLLSDHRKGPLVAAFRSPLRKALDRSVETLGL